MKQLSLLHIAGMILIISIVMILGIYSGKKIKNESDFSTGGRNSNAFLVCGALLGTMIGGASTIGTAQLAYMNGISAWWFTFGTGIGCILFGFLYVDPIRKSNCSTIQQIIANEYGPFSGVVTSILNTIGIILNIVTQIVSSIALLSALFGFSPLESSIISVVLMSCYVIFGGVLGAGILGIVKFILTYFAVIYGTYIVLNLSGGLENIYNSLPKHDYFNMFARGVGVDLGNALSVILGVISGQTYVQTILSGKDDKTARNGAILTGILIPPVGLGGVLIGMYMKINYPLINSGQAFPLFIIKTMPPLLAGAILATLLLALVGSGAGFALGFGTILTNDIYKKYININSNNSKELLVNRALIIFSILTAALISILSNDSTILIWGFLATGLRGTVLFVPFTCALFFKGKINSKFGVASSIVGVGTHLAGELLLNLSFDPLFLGLGAGIVTVIIGAIVKQRNTM